MQLHLPNLRAFRLPWHFEEDVCPDASLKSLLPSFGGSIVPETCAVPEDRCRLKMAGSTAMIAVCLVPLCPFKSLISVAATHCLVARLRSEKRPISTPLESLCHDRQPSRA